MTFHGVGMDFFWNYTMFRLWRGTGGQEPRSNKGGKSTGDRRREGGRWDTQGGGSQRNKAVLHEAIFLATFCCETSCKKDFTCNTPVLQPATATKCCVASYKKSRNILQHNFVKIRQSGIFQAGGKRVVNNFHRGRCKLRKNIANV